MDSRCCFPNTSAFFPIHLFSSWKAQVQERTKERRQWTRSKLKKKGKQTKEQAKCTKIQSSPFAFFFHCSHSFSIYPLQIATFQYFLSRRHQVNPKEKKKQKALMQAKHTKNKRINPFSFLHAQLATQNPKEKKTFEKHKATLEQKGKYTLCLEEKNSKSSLNTKTQVERKAFKSKRRRQTIEKRQGTQKKT